MGQRIRILQLHASPSVSLALSLSHTRSFSLTPSRACSFPTPGFCAHLPRFLLGSPTAAVVMMSLYQWLGQAWGLIEDVRCSCRVFALVQMAPVRLWGPEPPSPGGGLLHRHDRRLRLPSSVPRRCRFTLPPPPSFSFLVCHNRAFIMHLRWRVCQPVFAFRVVCRVHVPPGRRHCPVPQ
jgi:hypothetical protein